MSGSQSERLLDRDDLTRAFAALGKRLAERGVRAHMYVVGGAAMTMAYRRSRTTVDVDALTIDHRAAVLEAAGEVARELHLSADWLNENVRDAAKTLAAEKRAALLETERSRVRAIDRRIRRAESKLRGQARRDDTRRKVLAGAWVLEQAALSEPAARKLRDGLRGFLDRSTDRRLFDSILGEGWDGTAAARDATQEEPQ